MIRFEGIHKKYDDGFAALTNINLSFDAGKIHVLIGPSGCGKTTTMKLINRLILPSEGNIFIRDQEISRTDPVELRRSIGYVIQNIGLFPHMSIARNVGVVPRLLKWKQNEINKRTDELLDLVGLEPATYRERYPHELSGGQQQRIGVIRALAADPDIILMDEPFSALDPISREQLQDELLRLQQELKKTIIFVTHDMDEAIKIADDIVLMKEGSVVQQGRPEQILRHPANEFVESFVGKKRLQTEDDQLLVDDVMISNPVTAIPTRGLAESLKMMERRKVDSLYVVDHHKKAVGLVNIFQVLDAYPDEDKTLADIMQPLKHYGEPGMLLIDALQIMTDQHMPNLAIVDDSKFVGMITRGSVVRHMVELYPQLPKENEVHV